MEGSRAIAKSSKDKEDKSAKNKQVPQESENAPNAEEEEMDAADEYDTKVLFIFHESMKVGLSYIETKHSYFSQQPMVSKYPDITTPPPEKP